MTCPKCGSENVNVEMMQDIKIKNKHKGVLYWLFIGWWWVFIKWIFFTLPTLIIAIFKPKKQKVKTTNYKMCVCQSCGNSWKM